MGQPWMSADERINYMHDASGWTFNARSVTHGGRREDQTLLRQAGYIDANLNPCSCYTTRAAAIAAMTTAFAGHDDPPTPRLRRRPLGYELVVPAIQAHRRDGGWWVQGETLALCTIPGWSHRFCRRNWSGNGWIEPAVSFSELDHEWHSLQAERFTSLRAAREAVQALVAQIDAAYQ